jgi:hypothetical protein
VVSLPKVPGVCERFLWLGGGLISSNWHHIGTTRRTRPSAEPGDRHPRDLAPHGAGPHAAQTGRSTDSDPFLAPRSLPGHTGIDARRPEEAG